jgi:hypothetical protein
VSDVDVNPLRCNACSRQIEHELLANSQPLVIGVFELLGIGRLRFSAEATAHAGTSQRRRPECSSPLPTSPLPANPNPHNAPADPRTGLARVVPLVLHDP